MLVSKHLNYITMVTLGLTSGVSLSKSMVICALACSGLAHGLRVPAMAARFDVYYSNVFLSFLPEAAVVMLCYN